MEQWILYIISLIITASASVWAIVKIILPKLIDAKIEHVKDVREAEQRKEENQQVIQSDAFRQALTINDKLVAVLIQSIDANQKWQTGLIPLISDVRTQMTIGNREMARLEEILSDVDIQYHEIKSKLEVIINAMDTKAISEDTSSNQPD